MSDVEARRTRCRVRCVVAGTDCCSGQVDGSKTVEKLFTEIIDVMNF